jgi:DNA-binding IclR family transcriptional regulator
MPSSKRNPLYVSSVEKAFRVLRAFGQNAVELSLSQLSQATSLTVPNIQRLTHTLLELGYLSRDSKSKKYSLTLRALDIGYRYLQASPLIDRATPYLAELNRRTEETVNLSVLDGHEVVYVARHRGFHSIGINMFIGARLPAFSTSIGQAILAFLPTGEATEILNRTKRANFTRNTVTQMDALLKKLAKIRSLGFAVEDQEMFLGGISVAAPILGHEGLPIAAVNVAVPASRFNAAEAQGRFAHMLLETGRLISGPLASAPRFESPPKLRSRS